MSSIGRKLWAISGGRIPLCTHGHEPSFTSHDRLSILNTGEETADVIITIFYEDREPVGRYHVTVQGRRVRGIRLNDLIDPEAIPLDENYAVIVQASVPVIVQFTRLDSTAAANAIGGGMAYSEP